MSFLQVMELGKSYIFRTNDIENGTWEKTEINGMYHDASLLFDDDGKNYLVYGVGEIKIKELNSDLKLIIYNLKLSKITFLYFYSI